jgi:hypothetical protein
MIASSSPLAMPTDVPSSHPRSSHPRSTTSSCAMAATGRRQLHPLRCRLHLRSPSSYPAQPAPDPPRTLAPAAVNGRTHSPLPRWLLDPAGAWPREVSMFRCTRSVILATGVSEVGRRSGLARSLPACSGHCRPVPSVSTAGVAPPRACRH